MKKATAIGAAAISALFLLSVSACGSSGSTSNNGSSTSSSNASSAASNIKLIHPGKLTVCTNPPYAPFETIQGTTIVGMDMDILSDVAKTFGATLEPVNTAFEQIESGIALTAGNCDILASSISINAERAAKYDFSSPYFNDENGVLTKDLSLTNVAALKGKKIVVQRATTGEAWVKSQGLSLVETTDLGTQIQALKAGQADAAITDEVVLLPYATDGYKVTFTIETGEQFGFGVSKSNPGLLAAVNNTLRTMTSNGTMASLFSKYSIPASSMVTYDASGNPQTPGATPTSGAAAPSATAN